MPKSVICDASPLIALVQIGRLDLLRQLYATVLIPPAVAHETERTVKRPDWIVERSIKRPFDRRIVESPIGPGETEVLALALELGITLIVLDERRAHRRAKTLGLEVVGTLGVLLAAKRRNMVPALRPEIEALVREGFYLGTDIIERALAATGESG